MEEELLGIDFVLLTKYLNNEATESETYQVKTWIEVSDENKIVFEKIQKAWNLATASAGMNEWTQKTSKEQFLLKLLKAEVDENNNLLASQTNSWKIIRNVLAYAAVILILIGIPTLFIYRHYYVTSDKPIVENIFTQISAPKGSKTEMVLADGTKVWLNAGSTLKFNNNFNNKTREVYLDGEAYFDVAKNKLKPFLVKTSKITLRVLGTSFNVKSYSEEKTIETTLIKGEVKVEKRDSDGHISDYFLKPNQKAIFNKIDGEIKFYDLSEKKTEKEIADVALPSTMPANNQGNVERVSSLVEKDISWKDGYFLVFDETLESIMIKIARRFDLKIEFKNETIKQLRYSGKIKESTPEQILEALKITSPIEYEMTGNQVVIWENLNRKQKFTKK